MNTHRHRNIGKERRAGDVGGNGGVRAAVGDGPLQVIARRLGRVRPCQGDLAIPGRGRQTRRCGRNGATGVPKDL